MTANELLSGYRANKISPVEAVQSMLDQVEVLNPTLNALYEIDAEGAVAKARASEERWKNGEPLGVLDGVPVVIKDSIAVKGMRMMRGQKANRHAQPDDADAPPSARLREAGAILFAKSTMPDMGLLAAGVNSAQGVTRNPWDTSLNTGGSSAGTGAAVASGMAPIGMGSDVGGSVRLPASHCGLFAHKPTIGALPHLPYSDQRVAGPMTRSVSDAILMMSVLCRPDPRAVEPGLEIAADLKPAVVKGKQIGLLFDMGIGSRTDPKVIDLVTKAAGVFKQLGATIVEIPAPIEQDFVPAIYDYFSTKAALERAALPTDRQGEILPAVADICDSGTRLSALAYIKAQAEIAQAKKAFASVIDSYDLVLSPVMPIANFAADLPGADPKNPYNHLFYTMLVNQTGQPAASIHCGFSDTSPVGLQIIGSHGDDTNVLRAALAYEGARGFSAGFPEISEKQEKAR